MSRERAQPREDRPRRTRARPGPQPPDRGEADEQASHAHLLGLQQGAGNRAVEELLATPGDPVPARPRREFERSFGHDLDDVEVHRGRDVDAVAQGLDAAAFTVGRDVFVHSAVEDLESGRGKVLLGEELAHATQHGPVMDASAPGVDRLTRPDEQLEVDAHDAAERAVTGERAELSPTPSAAGAVARWFDIDDWISEEQQRAEEGAAPEEEEVEEATDETERDVEEEETEAEEETEEPAEGEEWDQHLPADEYERLQGGAIPRLEAVLGILEAGTTPRDLARARSVLSTIPDFINAFAGNAGADIEALLGAWGATQGALNIIDGILNPGAMLDTLKGKMATAQYNIRNLAARTEEPQVDEEGEPVPRTALTPGEAAQLLSGVADPLRMARMALGGEAPDYELASIHLSGVEAILENMALGENEIPTSIRAQLFEAGANVALIVEELEALNASPADAAEMAKSNVSQAIESIWSINPAAEGSEEEEEDWAPGGGGGYAPVDAP